MKPDTPAPSSSSRDHAKARTVALQHPSQDPTWFRILAQSLALLLFTTVLLLPLFAVFQEAFRKGIAPCLTTFTDPDAIHSVKLTLLVAAISVPLNLVFGVTASWAICKHRFPGKSLLITLIDLPFSVSPVISGCIYILLFGAQGWFAPLLDSMNLQIIFAVPGIVLATLFVTFPFVGLAELIPAMQESGLEEEQAAYLLGANGWQILFHVTLPNVRWSLLYGVLLCNARAMGEFGAVSVVSGHIRGLTNTIPLQVEILYNEYNFVAAFSMAALLALLALITLLFKSLLERRIDLRSRQTTNERVPNRTPIQKRFET